MPAQQPQPTQQKLSTPHKLRRDVRLKVCAPLGEFYTPRMTYVEAVLEAQRFEAAGFGTLLVEDNNRELRERCRECDQAMDVTQVTNQEYLAQMQAGEPATPGNGPVWPDEANEQQAPAELPIELPIDGPPTPAEISPLSRIAAQLEVLSLRGVWRLGCMCARTLSRRLLRSVGRAIVAYWFELLLAQLLLACFLLLALNW